jgi:hypothetical protein
LFPSCILISVKFLTEFVGQEKIVGENDILKQSAKEAYRSYILAYNSHSMKDIFNVHGLDLKVKRFWKALYAFGSCAGLAHSYPLHKLFFAWHHIHVSQ